MSGFLLGKDAVCSECGRTAFTRRWRTRLQGPVTAALGLTGYALPVQWLKKIDPGALEHENETREELKA